jgi:hypothetical protein
MLRRLTLPLVPLVVLALFSIAATAQETATQIATAIMVIAPLVLPFILKYVPLVGAKMVVLAYAVSVVVAIVAGVLSGLLTTASLSSTPGIIAAGTAVFGLMQLVYQLFAKSHTFGGKLGALVK